MDTDHQRFLDDFKSVHDVTDAELETALRAYCLQYDLVLMPCSYSQVWLSVN